MKPSKNRREIDKAIRHLINYQTTSEKWSLRCDDLMTELMEPVAEQLTMDIDRVEEELLGGSHGDIAWGYLFEEACSIYWINEKDSMIDEYLKKRGWREGAAGRRYLRALGDSAVQLWEVTSVKPGKSVGVRVMGSDDKSIQVREINASQTLKVWDCLATRVLSMGNYRVFTGAMLPFPSEAGLYMQRIFENVPADIRAEYEEMVKEGEIDAVPNDIDLEVAEDTARLTVQVPFTYWACRVLNTESSTLPEMRNTDHEPIVMTHFRFPITGDRERITKRLNNHTHLIASEANHWSWLQGTPDEQSTVLGQLQLTNTHLEFNTNSVERGERGVAFIAELLESEIGPALGVHESLESVLSKPVIENSPEIEGQLNESPEVQKAIQAYLTKHYRETLDELVPMLDNKTPRACATDPETREAVISWLKYLESMNGKSGQSPYDFAWMWEELGLSEYRERATEIHEF